MMVLPLQWMHSAQPQKALDKMVSSEGYLVQDLLRLIFCVHGQSRWGQIVKQLNLNLYIIEKRRDAYCG